MSRICGNESLEGEMKGRLVGTKPCMGSPEIGWPQSSRAGYFEIVANSLSDSAKKNEYWLTAKT